MQYFVVILSIFVVFGTASCRPGPTPATITKDVKIDLPGSERINKRSAEEVFTADLSDIPTDDDSQEDGDYSADYIPSEGGPADEIETLDSSEDFDLAESNIVFQPLFVSRKRSINKNRVSRSVDENQIRKKSLNENEEDADDDFAVVANGIVFLPLFRSKTQISERQRLRRSAEDVVSKTKTPLDVIETDGNLGGDEDMVYKSTLKHALRPVRSITGVELLRNGDGLVDDMVLAENGLIFRPLFRTRQRDAGSA